MPVRKLRPSHRSVNGKFPSFKTNRVHQHESTLERDFLYLLEYDVLVKTFSEQPFKILYTNEKGKKASYTPDFLVEYTPAGETKHGVKFKLFEVKYEEDLITDILELQPKFDAGIAYTAKKGWLFEVITETKIRIPKVKAITFLLDYLDPNKYDPLSNDNIAVAKRLKNFTVNEFMENIHGSRIQKLQSIGSLWQMVAKREFHINMDKEIDSNTVISVNP